MHGVTMKFIILHNILYKTERQEGSGTMCQKQCPRDSLMCNMLYVIQEGLVRLIL